MEIINIKDEDMEIFSPLKDQIDGLDITLGTLADKLRITKKTLWDAIFKLYPETKKSHCTILYEAKKILIMSKEDELEILQEQYGKDGGKIVFELKNPSTEETE